MTTLRYTLVCGKRAKSQHPTLEAAIVAAGRAWPECLVEIDPGHNLGGSRIYVYAIEGHAPSVVPTAEIIVGQATALAAPSRPARPAYTLTPIAPGARPKTCVTLEAAIDRVKRDWDGCRIEIGAIGRASGGCLVSILSAPSHWSEDWDVVAHIKREKGASKRREVDNRRLA